MREYWEEDLGEIESGSNTAPVEQIECSFVFNLAPAKYDIEDLPNIASKCTLCPVQRMILARAAKLLLAKDVEKNFLVALMGEQGEAFEQHLMSRMSIEDVMSKMAEIIARKDEELTVLDQELEQLQQEITALSWDCLGVRSGIDTSNGRPAAKYVFCDSGLVNGTTESLTTPIPAYIWFEQAPAPPPADS